MLRNKILVVFLIVLAIFGAIRLATAFGSVVVDAVHCMTFDNMVYEGTAVYMCDDFTNYALLEIIMRLFFF